MMVSLVSGLFGVVLWMGNSIVLPYNKETIFGFVLGIVALQLLGNKPSPEWDQKMGNLSYGVFLNHFLIQWVFVGVPKSIIMIFLYFAISLLLSFLTQTFIEKPMLHLRRRMRN